MKELEQIFTEMLNHIDKHKEAYCKPEWTNGAIVKAWVNTQKPELKKLFISGVVVSDCECSISSLERNGDQGYCHSCKVLRNI
jgi:hypothetical protein